jgi:2-oxoglutarate dehydrogenase complex dehydrogenase (E1) component-like enzyme
MKILTNSFSFQEGNDYLDVEVHEAEKWIELKIETTDGFPIQSREDLDTIYHKLCEILDSFENKETKINKI